MQTAPNLTPLRRRRACLRAACGILAASVLAGGGASAAAALRPGVAAASGPELRVLTRHLNQPKKLSFATDGNLLAALSGDGAAPASCTNGAQPSCLDHSGAIVEIRDDGTVRTRLKGLPSVSTGGTEAQATGPIQTLPSGSGLSVLFQGIDIDPNTGQEIYGTGGSGLEQLLRFSGSRRSVLANFGRYEALHNPDHGAGTAVTYGDSAIDSDPYAVVRYRGGFAVADAAANDVLFVSRTGSVSTLAVLPTISERAAAGTFGSSQTSPLEAQAQGVPDALAVGPDGALYVGELGGEPFQAGSSSIFRIVPRHRPAVYTRGLTAVGDITFDRHGRLLVLELDRKGLDDPGFNSGHPASGAVIRIDRRRRKSTLLSAGLFYPTGIAAAPSGTIYVANYGVSSAGVGSGGEILKITLPRGTA